MAYETKIDAARRCIADHQMLRGLEDGRPSTGIYHLLDSLMDYSAASGVVFEAVYDQLRQDRRGDNRG